MIIERAAALRGTIKVPGDILRAIPFFADVKGVTAVERDHIYQLPAPVKPRLEVR